MNRYSITTILVIVVLAIDILTRYQPAQATPKDRDSEEVVAKRLVIVDKDGKHRIELTVGDDGPVIAIRDSASKAGVLLGIATTSGSKEGERFAKPYISLLNKEGGEDVQLSTQYDPENRETAIHFHLGSETRYASLGVGSNGQAGLTLASGSGQAKLALVLRKKAGPFLFGYDDEGEIRMTMGVNPYIGRYALEFNDAKGKSLWSIPDINTNTKSHSP